MTLIKYTGAILLAASFSMTAHAQESGAYGAVGGTTYEFETYGLDAKLGYNFIKNFGIEVQGVLGLTSDSTRLSASPESATFTTKVDYTIGAFAIGRLPLNEQFEVFARGGLHNTQISADINNALNTEFEDNDTSFAAGGGLQYNLDSKNALRAEYTYLNGSELNVTSISFVRKF